MLTEPNKTNANFHFCPRISKVGAQNPQQKAAHHPTSQGLWSPFSMSLGQGSKQRQEKKLVIPPHYTGCLLGIATIGNKNSMEVSANHVEAL